MNNEATFYSLYGAKNVAVRNSPSTLYPEKLVQHLLIGGKEDISLPKLPPLGGFPHNNSD
jgi:hypothetical protein